MKKLIFRLAQVLCCLSFILMLLQYSLVLKYAKEGLFVWVSCVLPLLLPFIILSKFWIRYEIPQLFFKQVHRLVPAGTTIAISLPVFLLGLCSGFPVGAIFISHYYQQNLLNKRQAESLLPLASFVSPMFVAGYVRSQINLQERLWIYYLLCLYLPVLLCYLLLLIPDSHISAIYHRQKSEDRPAHPLSPEKILQSLSQNFQIRSLLPSLYQKKSFFLLSKSSLLSESI